MLLDEAMRMVPGFESGDAFACNDLYFIFLNHGFEKSFIFLSRKSYD